MKNHKGVVATLLTLGLVVVGTLITLGTSFFVSNQKTNLASNPRAAGPKVSCCKNYGNKTSDCPGKDKIGFVGTFYDNCVGANKSYGNVSVCNTTSGFTCVGSGSPLPASDLGSDTVATCEFNSKLACQNDDVGCPSNDCVTTGCKAPTAKCNKSGLATQTLTPGCSAANSDATCKGINSSWVYNPSKKECCPSVAPIVVPVNNQSTSTGNGPCCIAYRPDLYGCKGGQSKVSIYAEDSSKINCLSYGSSTMKYFFCNDYGASAGCSSNTPWGNVSVPAGGGTQDPGQGSGNVSGNAYDPGTTVVGEGQSCCFKKKGQIYVYASYKSMVDGGMLDSAGNPDCARQSAAVIKSYQADAEGAFVCSGNASTGMSTTDYENLYAQENPPVVPDVPTDNCIKRVGFKCSSAGFAGSTQTFDYYKSTAKGCESNTVGGSCYGTSTTSCSEEWNAFLKTQCGGAAPAGNTNTCVQNKCKALDTRNSEKVYYEKSGVQYENCANNTFTNPIGDLTMYCGSQTVGIQAASDNTCKQQSGDPLAYCPPVPLAQNFPCNAGFEKSNSAKCGLTNKACCVQEKTAVKCVKKNCQTLNSEYAYKAYYENNGTPYSTEDMTSCQNNVTSDAITNLPLYCGQAPFGAKASVDNSCKQQTGDPFAYCNNILPFGQNTLLTRNLPCKDGFEQSSSRCGITSTICCTKKQQQVPNDTVIPLAGDCFEQDGYTYCPIIN